MSKISGPAFDLINSVLTDFPFYQRFREGNISSAVYSQFLNDHCDQLQKYGLSKEDIKFASRFPQSETAFVHKMLIDLWEHGMIRNTNYNQHEFNQYAELIKSKFDHGSFRTYIYPEEARFIFALTSIIKPRSVAFMGSYYGYWAIWALPHIQQAGGKAYLVDLNPDVNRLAKKNLDNFGYENCTVVVTGNAIDFVPDGDRLFDLVVIDAEYYHLNPDPDYRGKAVYYPILKDSLPSIEPNGIVLCHNIILEKYKKDDLFFRHLATCHQNEYSKFLSLALDHMNVFLEYPSTEGIGIGQIKSKT